VFIVWHLVWDRSLCIVGQKKETNVVCSLTHFRVESNVSNLFEFIILIREGQILRKPVTRQFHTCMFLMVWCDEWTDIVTEINTCLFIEVQVRQRFPTVDIVRLLVSSSC